MSRNIPNIIKDVGFDFSWDSKKVWTLDLPVKVRKVPRQKNTRHFELSRLR